MGGRTFPQVRLQQTFAALRYRNYRLWFIGQLISLVGTWMQTTAQGYLIFQLTRSPVYLGYVGFAAGVPSWLFMLYGGVIADRISRRTLLLITQVSMMLLAFVLAGLTFFGLVQPWHILGLALALGIATSFDAPARQAFVFEMVEREDLANAIALNSSMFNLATVVGPAVSGLIYALVGPAWCFTLNGLSFGGVIVALLLMRLQPFVRPNRTTAALDELKEGLRYIQANPAIRTLIGVAAVISLFGLAYMTLIPAWAVTVLGGDETTNGWLQSARGLGALSGALMIATLGRIDYKGRLLTIGMFSFPGLLLLFALARYLPLSLLALVGVGWGFMILFNMANTLIQTLVSDELRGRVVSVYTLSFFGLMPLGALLAGGVAEVIGEPLTIIFSALISLAFALFLWLWVPALRRLA
ncbi:MAG: MFS transporter [Anaerolineae bacterium]|nr:MFS transporter [Anaerolineae bacterium]